jgi:NADPH-dependent 2,4-dienoyl-CoA reductase/sulfur reductase-like enzyme
MEADVVRWRRRVLSSVGLAAVLSMSQLVTAVPPTGPELSPVAAAGVATGDPHVVVYGGTPAGVAAAIGAAEHRVRVVLLTERGTVGGMMANGISATDVGSKYAVTGIPRRFFDRVKSYYAGSSEW